MNDWQTSVILLIFKRKGDVITYRRNKRVKLLEHTMKIVEMMLKSQMQTLLTLNKMLC